MTGFPRFYRSDAPYYRIYAVALLPLLVTIGGFCLYLWIGENQPRLALVGLLVLVPALVLTLLMAAGRLHLMMQPVSLVARAIQRLRNGEREVGVDVGSVGSVGDLGKLETRFNAMASEVVSGHGELQIRVDQAVRDAQESMEVVEIRNAELDLARRRAIEASRTKSRFLANMSHEIRTPMNGIIGFTSLLGKTQLNEKQRDYVSTIEQSAGSLLRIVDDILDFSKLESHKLVLCHEPFDLRSSVESAIALWAPQAHVKHLELVSLVYSDVPGRVVGDETRVIQILNNLLGNAMKFTDEGEIVLRVMLESEDERQAMVTFEVRDTGMGISTHDQRQLFQPFDQGNDNVGRLFGGSGLGLSICHALTTEMNGEMALESSPGEGSVFRVSLMFELDPDAPPARVVPPLKRQGLLVEPHRISRTALHNSLTGIGLAVDDLASIDDLEGVDFNDYDLIALACSVEEPALSESLRRLEQIHARHALPVIALVATSDHDLLDRFAEAGASYCLSKPPLLRHLRESVQGCLRSDSETQASMHRRPEATGDAAAIDHDSMLQNHCCLAVDDHPINLRLVTHLLEDMGATVLEAEQGGQAVEIVRKNNVDMVFMDIHMPHMNGLEAAREIRALHRERRIPIIALTADGAEKNRREMERADIDRYLIKPVKDTELRAVVSDILSGNTGPTEIVKASAEAITPHNWPVRDREQALRIAGGSDNIADTLFHELLGELPSTIEKLRVMLQHRNWSELWQTAHRLHGAAAICGVPALYHALGDLQPAITIEDETAVSTLLDRVIEQARSLEQLDE